MIDVTVPGFRDFSFRHLVLDYNGTLAADGALLGGVLDRLATLAPELAIHIITADTFGTVEAIFQGTPYTVAVLPSGDQTRAKADYVRSLGSEATVAIGNGRNDRLMLAEAALGISVVQTEGAAVQTLVAADIACRDIVEALELLSHPLRLIATLRG